MPIFYSVVSRGTTVLTKYASCVGNFAEVSEQIISKIPNYNGKLTYSYGNYLFHYICENRIIYMCIANNEFERSRAFLFLNEIKRRFQCHYDPGADAALAYSLNAKFATVLAIEMAHYSGSHSIDLLSKVYSESDELRNIMVKNFDSVAMRGEPLEILVDKAENWRSRFVSFRQTIRNLARKNIKLYIIIGLMIIVIIFYFLLSMVCGGLLWPECFAR